MDFWLQCAAMPRNKKQPYKIANIPPFGLRMPPSLHGRIKAAAEENARSMNSEIIARLEESFSEPRAPGHMTIVLEALPPGTHSVTMSVGEFFQYLSRFTKKSDE